MKKTEIYAEVVGDSISPQGERLTSLLITFPRIILSEINTHRMLSKNTSSSRAIPFNKMVEAVEENPFIPIAWQKHHSGMQGTEYITDNLEISLAQAAWIKAKNGAIDRAKYLYESAGVTKQLANRLLEPFMWTTMLITGSKEGWDNFFELRCPQYQLRNKKEIFKSWKELTDFYEEEYQDFWSGLSLEESSNLERLHHNKGQAEIHIMDLAEKIYDVMNISTPRQLKPGEWHIPFENVIVEDEIRDITRFNHLSSEEIVERRVKISTAMAARTSYTMVGGEKEINFERMVELHDRLIAQDPPHSSPMEHCAKAMNDREYETADVKCISGLGGAELPTYSLGWCRNFKGFIPYRHIIESK